MSNWLNTRPPMMAMPSGWRISAPSPVPSASGTAPKMAAMVVMGLLKFALSFAGAWVGRVIPRAGLLGSIAAISLLVGGIGIMNIMLVSVSERTREIGLRKAIGATREDILIQFLFEAVLMTCIGGILGILFGAGVSGAIAFFTKWNLKISLFSIILSTFFSFAVGLVFGIWPAQQASKLDPIEALRYE